MPTETGVSFLDQPPARILALLCFLLAAAALGYIHRADLVPGLAEEAAADDPLSVCVRTRMAELDRMLQEGLITQAQAETFRARVDGACHAQTGIEVPTGPPPLPQ